RSVQDRRICDGRVGVRETRRERKQLSEGSQLWRGPARARKTWGRQKRRPLFFSELRVENRGCTRARGPAPHLVILYQSSDLCSRLAAYRTDSPFWCRSCGHRTVRRLRNQCWGKARGSGKFRPARR